jgi:hypothetical protein
MPLGRRHRVDLVKRGCQASFTYFSERWSSRIEATCRDQAGCAYGPARLISTRFCYSIGARFGQCYHTQMGRLRMVTLLLQEITFGLA